MSNAPRIFSPDYYARMRSLESESWWNAGMRDVAAMLLELVAVPVAGRMIDVGCGSGQTMEWFLHRHPGWTSAGIDISFDAVGAARSAGLPVTMGSALDLPFDSNSADVLFCLDVLQHLPLGNGDTLALSEFYRVLRPGGSLFVRTNAQAFPHTRDDPANDFRKYTSHLLRSKVERAGFSVVRLSRINALLGLAEIPRELRATRNEGKGYHGILAVPTTRRGISFDAKRAVLRGEGSLIRSGVSLPAGRSIVALCIKR